METDDRRAVWEALSQIEDSLADGYRGSRPAPEFEESAVALPDATKYSHSAGAGNDSLDCIAAEAARCMRCRLSAGRTNVVPGQGASRPLVMVIGEGPGAEEDRTGFPFVGPAGKLLDKMLDSIGLSRQTNCFIGNIVKCRPPMNRDPAPDEQAACLPYLDRQIALLQPKAFLAVGRIPAQSLLGVKDGIGRLRGQEWRFRGVPLVATYHPSALLRDEALKRPAWEDLKLLRSLLDGLEA